VATAPWAFLCTLQNEVEVLEQRINALEIGKQYDATKEEVRKVEGEYLLKLREIKQAKSNNELQLLLLQV
jgi:DNA-directed RNA polymerase sigma subunit (sigma70/sigma32)